MSEPVHVEDLGSVQVWRLGLAPVNAINATLLDGLDSALTRAAADPAVAVVVVASKLKVFSAGADASWMAATVAEIGATGLVEEFNRTMDRFRNVCQRLRDAPFLVIAALQGHTLAGGLELAVACDLRFCGSEEKIQLGVPEMDLFGVLPSGGGGAQFLSRILGPSRALDFILTAKPITPARALELGLVDRLYPREEVLDAATQFAKEVATKAGRIGVHAAKRSIFGGPELPLTKAMAMDSEVHWDAMRRGNFLTGVEAFTARFASKSGSA